MEFSVTRDEAGSGYGVLAQHEGDSYLAMMWKEQVERRYKQGDAIETLMEIVLRAAYSWYAKASAAVYPTHLDKKMCLDLFEAMGVTPPDPANTLSHGDWGTNKG